MKSRTEMVALRILILLAIFVVATDEYGLLGASGDSWTNLPELTLRAVDYGGKFRVGVAPDLIANQQSFPCLTQPTRFKIKGSASSELLPLKVHRLEPLVYPEELWKNPDFARIRKYIEMWEAIEPEVRAERCGEGEWCVKNLEVGHYIVYLGESLRAARNNVKGAKAFGFQVCP